jgi:cytochrome c553
MIRMLSVALAVSLFAAPVLAAEPPKEPITLKSAKQGDITFKHDSATHKAQKCEVCHGAGEPGKMTLDMKKGHAVCQDCHKKQENKALAKCDNCHKKAK